MRMRRIHDKMVSDILSTNRCGAGNEVGVSDSSAFLGPLKFLPHPSELLSTQINLRTTGVSRNRDSPAAAHFGQ
jgi:hypothetical protein